MGSDYDIGYRKPPKRTRFTKGRSGNPKGRPKGTRNLRTAVLRDLDQKIKIREGGRVKNVTKRDAIAAVMVNAAIKGDTRAARYIDEVEAKVSPESGSDATTLAPADKDILDAYVRRILEHAGNRKGGDHE